MRPTTSIHLALSMSPVVMSTIEPLKGIVAKRAAPGDDIIPRVASRRISRPPARSDLGRPPCGINKDASIGRVVLRRYVLQDQVPAPRGLLHRSCSDMAFERIDLVVCLMNRPVNGTD